MTGTVSSRMIAAGVLALSLALLTACSTNAAPGGGLTLAQSKSPVQLLRNEAATRIPPAVIESVSDTEDLSVRCRTESEDPIGLRRSWHSNAKVTIARSSVWRVDAVVDGIAQTFVDQGWVATPLDGTPTSHVVKLTKEGLSSVIRVASNRPDPTAAALASDATDPVTIELDLNGPCVDTDGPQSDEVKKLEAQD